MNLPTWHSQLGMPNGVAQHHGLRFDCTTRCFVTFHPQEVR